MKPPTAKAKTGKKPGRKTKKVRSHVSLSPPLNAAAEYLGNRTFGNKTAFLEHLILQELKANGLDIADIERLAKEWDEKHAEK